MVSALLVLKLSKWILPAKGPSAVSKSVVSGHTTSPISLNVSMTSLDSSALSVVQISFEDHQATLGQVGNELRSHIGHILVSILGSPEIIIAKLAVEGNR